MHCSKYFIVSSWPQRESYYCWPPLLTSQIAANGSGSEAVIFDVAVLEKTANGKNLLRQQLLPMFRSKMSTKVTCHAGIKPRGSLMNIPCHCGVSDDSVFCSTYCVSTEKIFTHVEI